MSRGRNHAERANRFNPRRSRPRQEATDERQWKPLQQGWCLGSEQFKAKLLEGMETRLGKHHSGQLRQESAAAKGERLIAAELRRSRWTETDLKAHPKSHPVKLALAIRLRQETTLTIRELAQRLHMGSWKSLNNKLYLAGKARAQGKDKKAQKWKVMVWPLYLMGKAAGTIRPFISQLRVLRG